MYRKLVVTLALAWLISMMESYAQIFPVKDIVRNGSYDKLINIAIMGDGYTGAEQPKLEAAANRVASGIFQVSPFKEYATHFNVVLIQTISAESGVTHPGTTNNCGTSAISNPNTLFKVTLDRAGTHRLPEAMNTLTVMNVLSQNFPQYDLVILISNTDEYAGSGGFMTIITENSESVAVAIHELGHSLGGLADEYYAGDYFAYEKPNMTQNSNPQTVKWKNWVNSNGIGVNPHCCSGNAGTWYKPSSNWSCGMEGLNRPFCSVCQETLIERIHDLVNPVDGYEPALNAELFTDQDYVFKGLLSPFPINTFGYKMIWYVDGVERTRNINQLMLPSNSLSADRDHTITFVSEDQSTLLRVDNHASSSHARQVSWTVRGTQGITPVASYVMGFGNNLTAPEVGNCFNNSTNATRYEWYMNEILISTEVNPSVTFANPGTYYLKLIAYNGTRSSSQTMVFNIQAPPPPVAVFSPSASSVVAGSTVSFTNNSLNATAYSWSLPGATPASSTASNPQVVYSQPGTYAITLTATGPSGSASSTKTITVTMPETRNAIRLASGGNVSSTTLSALNGVNRFTVESWVNFSTLTDWNEVWMKAWSSTSRVGVQITATGRLYVMLANGANTFGYTTANTIVPGNWYHVALVYDGTQRGNSLRVKLFVNGVQRTLTFSGTIPASTPTNAAGLRISAIGQSDELRVWNTTLAPLVLDSWRNKQLGNCHPNAANLALYWNFDNAQNSAAVVANLTTSIGGSVTNGQYVSSTQAAAVSGCTTSARFLAAADTDPAAVSLYPNPILANNLVNVKAGKEIGEIEWVSSGRPAGIRKTDVNEVQLNTQGLTTGVHLLRIRFADGSTQISRLVIEH